ncbi:MAG: (2Fe-2S) ferredoxin domain-containing protein [Elainella sp.]
MGSAKVLTAFQTYLAQASADPDLSPLTSPTTLHPDCLPAEPADASVIDITVTGCHCLGECGNGPMVLVLPEQIWYYRIHPDEVAAIVQHLQRGELLPKLLYPKFHPV